MDAIIYSPKKNAMQSKSKNDSIWRLEFIEEKGDRFTENLMGRISSVNMNHELKYLDFQSKEKAIKYAEIHNIQYEIKSTSKSKLSPKSYADNFKATSAG